MKFIKIIMKYIYFKIIQPMKFYSSEIDCYVNPKTRLGKHLVIKSGCTIFSGVTIGDHTFINHGTRVEPFTESIGRFCSISFDVKIGLGPHPTDHVSTSPVFYAARRGVVENDSWDEAIKGNTIIEHDVWIGANAMIMAGVKVGTGAIVAAGSVVTHDVEPYSIVGGVPAKKLRYRFNSELIKRLLDSQWWDLDIKELKNKIRYMSKPERFLSELDKK